jgi:hypothetical protein
VIIRAVIFPHKEWYFSDNEMKKFFYSHPDIVLTTIAIVLLVTLIGFFSWGINDIVVEIKSAMVVPVGVSAAGFDLRAASQVNYHGLVSGQVASSTVTIPPPSTIKTNTSTTP